MNKVSRLSRQFISNLKTHQLVTDNKRNLILLILKSTTTKREARNYLEKYENQFDANSQRDSQRDIYISRFLLKSVNPFGGIYELDGHRLEEVPLRIAIFRIKPAGIAIREWLGIRETLKRLLYLGINPVILLDYDNLPGDGELPGGGGYIDFKFGETYMMQQGNIISQQLGKGVKTTVLRSLFSKSGEHIDCSLEQILVPLYQQIIPVIQPIVYNSDKCVQEFGKSNTLLSEITLQLLHKYKRLLSIEKVVMVDALGGIPSVERNQTSHVFINLSQEYADIVSELYIGYIDPAVRDMHLHNLHTMNKVLSGVQHELGNDDTTGIITTPQIMSINDDQLNPVIYNVLTDRPVISSSLPSSNTRTPKLSTSILKKGIDVHVWDKSVYPHHDGFTIENLFKHNIVDREKFASLINDSFGKELQVEEYFSRINETVGTVIILGDYDGAAVITYEKDIPYLDKFAIAKRNQGLPGLADIIFKIILQSHPQELIWRLRKNNPVNKWYFDRCYGSLSLPESQWKIFYTGEIFDKKINKFKKKRVGGVDIGARLHVYSDICEGIPASFGSKI